MAAYKSKAIVLSSIRYGEADRILTMYTFDKGLVSAIAKGVRRTTSRFGGRLEPLTCIDFLAYQGRSLDTVTQVETLKNFQTVRGDLRRLEAAGGMVQAVRLLSGGDEADRRVFNLLYRGLEALEQRETGFQTVETAFKLKSLALAGYSPQLDRCVSCMDEVEDRASKAVYFTPSLGGVLCSDCRTANRDAFAVPYAALHQLKSLMPKPLLEVSLKPSLANNVNRVVQAHIMAHAPGSSMRSSA